MKFAVIGGDMRIVSLGTMLQGEGHEVRCFALDRGDLRPVVRRQRAGGSPGLRLCGSAFAGHRKKRDAVRPFLPRNILSDPC
jgi:hypothetical protein